MLLAKKTKSTALSEQTTSLFLHSAQQIIGNLQTINILYQFFQTLPVISSGALGVTAVLSFPKWWNQSPVYVDTAFWHIFHTFKSKAHNYQQKGTAQGFYRAHEGWF